MLKPVGFAMGGRMFQPYVANSVVYLYVVCFAYPMVRLLALSLGGPSAFAKDKTLSFTGAAMNGPRRASFKPNFKTRILW